MWPLRRAPLPPTSPVPAPVPPDANVSAVLGEVARLRLLLDADFAVAAGALDAGAPDVARDVVAGQRRDVADFQDRALRHLGADPSAAPAAGAPVPASRRHRVLSSRALPAAPMLAAAAVAAAVAAGVLGGPVGPAGHATPITSRAVAASWQRLDEVTAGHADAQQVLAAMSQLQDSITPLIAGAKRDPATAAQALSVLTQARALLLKDAPPGASAAIAEADALLAQLASVLPAPTTPSLPAILPLAGSTPAPQPASAPPPSSAPASTGGQATSKQQASGTSATAPTPAPSQPAAAQPSAAPPSSAPSPSPSWQFAPPPKWSP